MSLFTFKVHHDQATSRWRLSSSMTSWGELPNYSLRSNALMRAPDDDFSWPIYAGDFIEVGELLCFSPRGEFHIAATLCKIMQKSSWSRVADDDIPTSTVLIHFATTTAPVVASLKCPEALSEGCSLNAFIQKFGVSLEALSVEDSLNAYSQDDCQVKKR
ncbi:hypothetical protein KSP39_PZI020148 [Platanthera zijinensis]|uniref:Uncharacterized protein n=1 Tax=Platanthera zijinensis TaxID=2320716 RepID=A0AAP0B0I7_9ASPA